MNKFFDAFVNNDQVSGLIGVSLKVIGCLSFAAVNGLVKYATVQQGIPVIQITFFQNFFGALFCLPIILYNYRDYFPLQFPKLHNFRLVCTILGNVAFQSALFLLPISHAIAFGFIGPIINILGARFILKEPFSKPLLISILIAFCAGLIIARPYSILFSPDKVSYWYYLLPVVAVTCFAGSTLSARVLASNGQSATLLSLYQMIATIPVLLLPALYFWQSMTLQGWVCCMLIGIVSSIAFISWNRAYSMARVNFLSPWGFLRLVFTSIIGYYFFGEHIHPNTIPIGISVITLNLIIINISRFKK